MFLSSTEIEQLGRVMFLTAEQTAWLTGRKRPKAQIKWLADRGYKFDVSAAGWPIVASKAVEERFVVLTRERKARPRLDLVNDK